MSSIAILVASSNNNQKLGLQLQELAAKKNISTQVINLVDLNFPLYNTIEQEKNGIPQSAKDFTEQIMNFKGFIVVAPEYNGVMPPVLNNAISWVSVSTEDWRLAFNEKIVALATHSGGGGAKGLQAMRIQFQHMGANVLSREILTTYEKPLSEESANNILDQLEKLC